MAPLSEKALLADIQGRQLSCVLANNAFWFIMNGKERLFAFMKKLNDLEYLKLSKSQAFLYNLMLFFCAIPAWLKKVGQKILGFFKTCGLAIKNEFADIGTTFSKGNWAVKLSFFIFGFGNLFYGQVMRGILFLLFEVIFIAYLTCCVA